MKAIIEIYTWSHCRFSIQAKALLDRKGLEYIEYSIDEDIKARKALGKRANGDIAIPQIFINGQHIGGCNNLYILEEIGSLDELVNFSY